MAIERLGYFATSLWKRLAAVDCDCPNCNSKTFQIKDQKYFVTELRRCEDCRLLYRAPTDSKEDNRKYYQDQYNQTFTTTLPDEASLKRLVATNFVGIEFSYDDYISTLSRLGLRAGHRIFDFGCSWGYGSWQLANAGFEVVAYEISRSRAAFAREKLDINILDALPELGAAGDLAGTFDCFFSSHVIEHVPQPSQAIEMAGELLKPGGYFVAFTPNGSDAFRSTDPEAWHRLWGKVHPNLIDDEFWEHALGDRPALFDTSPINGERLSIFHLEKVSNKSSSLNGGELMCVARF